MAIRSSLTSGQATLVSFVMTGLALLASGLFLAVDSYGAAPGADWPMVGIILFAAIPLGCALWHLKKPAPWLGFGLWIGTFCLLPWVPWSTAKQFFFAASRLREGMSVAEVRQTMGRFREETRFSPGSNEERLVIDSPDKEAIAAGRLVWVTHEHFEHGAPPQLESLTYRWDPNGLADLDAVMLSIEHGHVKDIEIERD